MFNAEKTNQLKNVSVGFMFLGFLSMLFVFFPGFQERVWHSYLLSYMFFILISLGGVFFISIHYASGAGWSTSVRRLSEALTAYLPVAAVMTLPLLYGAFVLYDWLDPAKVAQDHLLEHKKPYLNFPFFLIRCVVFIGGWIFFSKKLLSFSLKQDQDGDALWTKKGAKYSILFLLFFCFSLSLFSVDFLMSLDAHWFSTIFGVYVFAGLFQSIFAALILLCVIFIKSNSQNKKWINKNHLHDLGKYLFGATIFWAYIAFSQYMLIWYANLPEETTFFVHRSKGSWAVLSICLLVFKFIVPFFILLPKWVKRNLNLISGIAVFILIMQFVDLYWLIYPNYDSKLPRFGFLEVGIFLGFLGIFIRVLLNFFSKYSPISEKDPRIMESIKHHVTY